MKKMIIVIALFVITLFVSDLNATCPPGYTSGADVTHTSGLNCSITVHWCHKAHTGQPDDIFISGYDVTGDCDFLLIDVNGNIIPSTTDMLSWILDAYGSILNVPDVMTLVDCNQIGVHETTQMEMTVGECYQNIWSQSGTNMYAPCQPLVIGKCCQYYRLCRVLVGGIWRINVVPFGPPSGDFNCSSPCYKLCQ